MWRLILLLTLALGAATLAAWFADHPGRVTMVWMGWRLDASVATLVFLSVMLLAFGLAAHWLWVWLRRDNPFAGANRTLRRERRGAEALNGAMIALSAGRADEARKLSAKALRLLPPQPLIHVIAAESAKLDGDDDAARAHYEALQDHGDSAFLGLRGLTVDALRRGKTARALSLVREAAVLEPKSAWALALQFDLETRTGDWTAAAGTLARLRRLRLLDGGQADAHEAVLHYTQALDLDLAGDADSALTRIKSALKLRPGLTPAALLAARLHVKADDRRKAEKELLKAFGAAPHPDLVPAFEDLQPMETATARLKRAEKLAEAAPGHIESRLLMAREHLAADHVAASVGELEALLDAGGDWRLDALLDRIPVADRGARLTALDTQTLPPPPRWTCGHCERQAEAWAPHCPACGDFDTLEWRSGARSKPALTGPGDDAIRLLPEAVSAPPPAEG